MKKITFLTLAEVVEIHADQIERYGGSDGIRDINLLSSAVAMPLASFSGSVLHEDIFEMAAAYVFHISQNHPFVDGNKRTGLASALVFLELNGISPSDPRRTIHMIGKRKPTHPGEVLSEDVIKPLGLTVTEAAKRLGVTRKTLSTLLNGKASLSPKMAVRIAKATNTSAESWLYMQAKLDLWIASKKSPKVQDLKEIAVG